MLINDLKLILEITTKEYLILLSLYFVPRSKGKKTAREKYGRFRKTTLLKIHYTVKNIGSLLLFLI